MSGGALEAARISAAARVSAEPAGLLSLVFASPRLALAGARAVLAADPTPYDASIAHHAIGLVQREFGELPASIARLRRALALARRSGSPARVADVQASLGIALVHAGRTTAGLAALRDAASGDTGPADARVRFRLGGALWVLGRHEEALAELRAAVPVLREAGDTVWLARALTVRGMIQLALGLTARADRDFQTAARLFADTDQEHDSAVAVHNRGLVAFRAGDLPAALGHLEEADRRYRLLGTPMPQLVIDRCAILLAAGLPNDALTEADTASGHLSYLPGHATRRAELVLIAARAAAAAGRPAIARERADAAVRLFATQQREWWRVHAKLLLLHSRFAMDDATGRLGAQVEGTARRLEQLGSPEVTQAWLLAGRIALRLGRTSAAEQHLAAAARDRHRGSAVSRMDGWLAQALQAASAGQGRRTLAACRRGLDLLDEHRYTFGATELRARTTAQGAELVELGLRTLLPAGSARQLLLWSERWRATGCAVPPVHPPDDHPARDELAALREITSRLEQAREQGLPTSALDRERQRLERQVRSRTLRTGHRPTDGYAVAASLDISLLLDAIGPGRLVELVAIGGDVHVLICGEGRVRRVRAGRSAEAIHHLEFARWTLHRLAYGASPRVAEDLLARLTVRGSRMEAALLGPAVRHLGDGPVVIVPPGRMHGVPWGLLPSLADRVHGVAPSAAAWLQARTAPPPPRDRVVLICGPNLASRAGEIPALACMYPDAHLLQEGAATAARVLDALNGSSLAHIAAHGMFRADNPLFSAIKLDDGPLTVYDFERLRQAPYRLVLPCCESGRLEPVGADELLGLTAALLPLGTAGIVASLVPVNDAATVPLMLSLHRAIRAGGTLAEALQIARRGASDDPVHRATALSFVALGAA